MTVQVVLAAAAAVAAFVVPPPLRNLVVGGFSAAVGAAGVATGAAVLMDHEGSLELICNQDRLLKIFRITGLAKVFTIHPSAEAALA